MTLRLTPAALILATLILTGCHAPSLPTPAREEAKAEQQAQLDTQREQLAMIPPPSKNRFMTVRSIESWENPYLTVQPGMYDLHVLMADANPTDIGAGGMFRPVGARRQVLTISPDKLADAITSIPVSAWPYGRVMAIEEAHNTPPAMRPAVRRAMEAAISRLNDLGVIVYDPSMGSLR